MITVGIIHNEQRTERLDTLMYEIGSQGIKQTKIFPAIKEKLVQTGISKAHKQVVQYAKDNGLKEIMVCEDDVKFVAPNAFNYAIENKPDVYDIYLLGVSGGVVDEINKTVIGFSGLFCYMIHERFYDVFLEADEGSHLDRWLSGFNNKVSKLHNKTIEEFLGRKPLYKICYPIAAITYNGYSDNFERHMEYDKYFVPYRKYKGLEISA